LANVPLGFQPENVLTMRVLPQGVRYTDFHERLNFYQQVLDKMQNVHGVESVGAVSFLPLTRTRQYNTFSIEGRAFADMSWSPSADIRAVTPGYLEAMKIALLGGTTFSWEDTPESSPVVIVSTKLVQEFFPNGGAIGSHIRIGNPHSSSSWRTVIGIVDDVPYFDISSPRQPTIYVPYAQSADLSLDLHDLAVRAKQSPASVAGEVRNAIWSVDSNLAVSRVRTMEDVYSISVTPQRFNLLLLALMAGLVLLLAAIGLYGVTSYSVAQRTREIAVRLVLGAAPAQVVRLILFQSGLLVIYGVTGGLVLSFSLTSLIKNLLFNVSTLDPITYGLVAVLLSVVGLVACFGPARAAMRIDPITVLRYE
jgi:putative ABC transport system permease protein